MNRLFSFFLFFVLPAFAWSQQYSFVQYSLKEGLPQSQVRSIFQDQRGFIWVGTLGGISRFDGRSFVSYSRREGLLNNQINSILELQDGRVLAGSSGSVSIVTPLAVKSLVLENFKEAAVNALYQDPSGKIYIGTENGIAFLENDQILYPAILVEPFTAHIKAFIKKDEDSFFIISKEKVFLFEKGNVSLYFEPNDRSVNIFDAEIDDDGRLWLATKGSGLLSYLPAEGERIHGESQGLKDVTLTTLTKSSQGSLFIGSRFGFYIYEGGSVTFIDQNKGLKTPDIRDVCVDYEGNVWLGSNGSGLLKFTGRAFLSYTTSEGLSSDAVMSITEDTNGHIWLSTFDAGVCEILPDTVRSYNVEELTGNNRIWTSLTDKNGALWFGSSFGLFSYTKKKFKSYGVEDSLSDPMILSLLEDSKGLLWIGTAKGLCVMENGKIKNFKAIPGNPETRIRDIQEDKSGNIWLATRGGVYKFDRQRFTLFNEAQGLPDRIAYCIEVDPQNRVWVGTQNGLAVLESERFNTVDLNATNGSSSINFLKYYFNEIWFGTNNGLYSFSSQVPHPSEQLLVRRYGLEDGLRSLETNLNAVYVDSKDRLWFGTAEGVMLVQSGYLGEHTRRIAPKVALTSVQINFLTPDWSKFRTVIDPQTGLPIEPEVDYKNNHFTFQFTGISMTYPEDVKYQFMLEGFDQDWQALTNSNFITYSNLPYEHFVFKVRAVSKEGAISEPVVFAFSVEPPFWWRWWFIVLEVVAVASLIFLIWYVRRRVTRAKFEREKLEWKSRMLTLEQQSLNSSMNRHFIFNALNSIQYYINRQDRLAANKYLSDFAKLIRKNLDSSQETLTTLREEIERLELYLKLEHMRFKDKFEYEVYVDPSIPQDAVKVPAMLLQPFLENSIWHGLLPKAEPGKISVRIVPVGKTLHMVIEDNGIGVENSLKSKLGTDQHISKGMQITQNRLELIRKMTGERIELIGPQQIDSDSGEIKGTIVEIIIPDNFHELFS